MARGDFRSGSVGAREPDTRGAGLTEILDAELMTVAPDEVVVTFRSRSGREVATTVGEDAVVTTGPFHVARFTGLEPSSEYRLEVDGAESSELLPHVVKTLPLPSGRLLARVATANDVHFGEVECGRIEAFGPDQPGPVFAASQGAPPYPELMNASAVDEIGSLGADVVLVKGDLTTHGTEEELEAFFAAWLRLGERLRYVRGNHDAAISDELARTPTPYAVELPGVTLAVLDTVIFKGASGRVTAEQLQWLDELAAGSTAPILVFGHHHVWSPRSKRRERGYFGINPDDSEALIRIVGAREAIAGYFAGHTHRNRVRRFEEARGVPFVEVACVKDYPGSWAEYRIHEAGYTQVHRRIADAGCLAWTEETRGMFAGSYRDYALGDLASRCFTQPF